MVTKRLSVSAKRVNWFDGQQVTRDEMIDEQNRHVDIDAANIANFLGSGVVRTDPVAKIIFDTESLNSQQQTLFDGYSFDGQNVYVGSPLPTVSDETQGVHLSVTLSDVDLAGAETTRVAIFGLSFGDNLIHDDLVFKNNGTQITRGRYKEIRGILFNNFAGNLRGSRSPAVSDGYEFIGRCVIKEAEVLEASHDTIIASQTNQPNVYFSEFEPASFSETPTEMLQEAIGSDQSIADLNIGLSSLTRRELAENDVTTKIGQKFLAKGENIQKISVLLAVKENAAALPADAYNWSGSIALSVHALQTEVDCPTDPIPDNLVDFDPEPATIALLTLDKDTLEKQGVVLDGYSRVVEFVLTGTQISDPSRTPIEKDRYYALTLSRTGDASVGTLLVEEAPHRAENGYMIVFDGVQWINVRESDMWFKVEGDYVKVSDGIAYEDGIGVEVPKIAPDDTNTEVPYVEGLLTFTTVTTDAENYILVEQQSEFSEPEQDQRTGNLVFSRVNPEPAISLISQSELDTLTITKPAPVLLGSAVDKNPRGNPATISGSTTLVGLVRDNLFNILNPDADILSNNLLRSIIIPNTAASAKYRIIRSTLYTDAYGDINGDGVIDEEDLAIISGWIADGYSFDLSTAAGQQEILDGYATIEQVLRADLNGDGVVDATDEALLTSFLNKSISTFPVGSTFTRMQLKVENILDPLTAPADIDLNDATFVTAPFPSTPWRIDYCASWLPDLLTIEDLRRDMPTTFTEPSSDELPGGRNDFYIPGNLLLDGYQLNPDGTPYSHVDLEVTHFAMNIPITDSYGAATILDGYKGILLFDNFVAESSEGKTAGGFNAMKYADGTYVQLTDFDAGKVKIVPALQSITNEYSTVPSTIEDIVGVHYDPDTSLMTVYVKDIFDDGYGNTLPSLTSKIVASVYLKKSGFRNPTQEITQQEMRTLLGI